MVKVYRSCVILTRRVIRHILVRTDKSSPCRHGICARVVGVCGGVSWEGLIRKSTNKHKKKKGQKVQPNRVSFILSK